MATIKFKFLFPNGEPAKNADIEIHLSKMVLDPGGIITPLEIWVETDEQGEALIDLAPSSGKLYYASFHDPASARVYNFKFIVPNVPEGTVVSMEAIQLNELNPIRTPYDESAFIFLNNVKALASGLLNDAENIRQEIEEMRDDLGNFVSTPGPQGPQGIKGDKGDKGDKREMFSFGIEGDDLVLYYTDEGEPPNFYINEYGELIADIESLVT